MEDNECGFRRSLPAEGFEFGAKKVTPDDGRRIGGSNVERRPQAITAMLLFGPNQGLQPCGFER